MILTNPGTSTTFTLTDATTSSTDFILTFITAPMPSKKTSRPAPPPLRAGETVRVTTGPILKGRVGKVTGFLEADGKRIAFVSWPDGGWTNIAEGDLERAGKKK